MNESLMIEIAEHATPLGPIYSSWSSVGLYRLSYWTPDAQETAPPRSSQQVDQLDEMLQRYFCDGTETFADVVIDPSGWTPLSRTIYQVCRRIAPGSTMSYQALARAAGRPNAARAAGAAMARNRVMLVIPCHRVLSSGGKLGGFSAPGGLQTKQALLDLEQVGCWPEPITAS